jgi:hypothetical protein
MSTYFIPRSDVRLRGFASNFNAKVQARPDHYEVSAALAGQLDADTTDYLGKLAVADDESTRTRVTISRKNAAKIKLIATCQAAARIIQAGPATTNAVRYELALPVRGTPSPIPAPAEAPCIDVVSVSGCTVHLRLHTATGLRGKPAGAAAARFHTFIGPTPPQELCQWAFAATTSRTKTSISFDLALPPGATIWLIAAWINAKQQSGPLSQPAYAYLQHGVSSGAAGGANMPLARAA